MRALLVVLALLLGLFLIQPSWPLLQAEAQGAALSVRGQVANGTAGGPVPANIQVVLHAFRQGAGQIATYRTLSGPAGEFQFNDVAADAGSTYALTMEYLTVTYSVLASATDLAQPLEVVVYETTRDAAVVRVERQALLITDINAREQDIGAVEFVRLVNPSDRTLLPDLSSSSISFLRFPLPPGARELDVRSDLTGGQIIPIGTGFAVTAPVLPGGHDLNYAFRFPYQGVAVSYRQSLLQGAAVYQVLIPQRLPPVQVTGLESRPLLDLDGTTYRVWEARGVAPGQGPTVEIAGLPQPTVWDRTARTLTSQKTWQWFIPSAFAAFLAVLLIYSLVKSPGRLAAAAPGAGGRQELVQAIAFLDDRFERGELAEAQYRQERGRLKSQILAAAEQQEGAT
ncbi:MAG: hypothetical protein FJ316_09660 [SAR202 cluster bacterium]|nr:hypothetical protein [SAR202 cluster bacterium]